MKVCPQPPPTFNPCLLSSSRTTLLNNLVCSLLDLSYAHTHCLGLSALHTWIWFPHFNMPMSQRNRQWESDLNPKFSILSLQFETFSHFWNSYALKTQIYSNLMVTRKISLWRKMVRRYQSTAFALLLKYTHWGTFAKIFLNYSYSVQCGSVISSLSI